MTRDGRGAATCIARPASPVSRVKGNRNRLASMTYPKPALEGGGREVSFFYGESGSVDEALDRVTKIDDDGWGELAKYTYMGLSRRVALMLAGVVTHSVAAGGGGAGYPGLDPGHAAADVVREPSALGRCAARGESRVDRFGRPVDLHYQLNAQDTIHRYQPLTSDSGEAGGAARRDARRPSLVKGQYGYDLAGNP